MIKIPYGKSHYRTMVKENCFYQDRTSYIETLRGQKPKYEVAMELKYVKKAGKKAVETIFKDANIQLQGYLDTPKFNTRANIKSFVVVVAGGKLTYRELK